MADTPINTLADAEKAALALKAYQATLLPPVIEAYEAFVTAYNAAMAKLTPDMNLHGALSGIGVNISSYAASINILKQNFLPAANSPPPPAPMPGNNP
jgi:hypothetical protein